MMQKINKTGEMKRVIVDRGAPQVIYVAEPENGREKIVLWRSTANQRRGMHRDSVAGRR